MKWSILFVLTVSTLEPNKLGQINDCISQVTKNWRIAKLNIPLRLQKKTEKQWDRGTEEGSKTNTKLATQQQNPHIKSKIYSNSLQQQLPNKAFEQNDI